VAVAHLMLLGAIVL